MRLNILLFLFITSISFSQNTKTFPTDFFGKYKGKLNIYNQSGNQVIDMELHLLPTDTIGKYRYTIIYKSDKTNQERKYTLIEKDKAKGVFIIDENNGILLNALVKDNTLYSIFEVQNSLLTTTEHFKENYVDFEIMYTHKTKVEKSGDNTEENPEVLSYPVMNVQKARLFRE
ncbi:hypothetical protein FIA58_005310 [Flavobacterium jejuense]|uniref:DUF4488 domain-containing protein n=1 Tax=Flavobacterium jejuense TaxID=1544455 RepID=A0ABX0IQB2_9FLAO|nr:hypothetical protein [Flavobacterium jejuense]NHN25092.1 hypothetical protein [Flavobacterium jejuense]